MISGFPHTHLITCPVFGAPAAADKAQLLLVMSGDYRSKKEVAYILVPAIGRKVIDLGGNLEKGERLLSTSFTSDRILNHSIAPTLKLIGNSMILGTIEIMAEAYTLAEKSGIGAESVHSIVKGWFCYSQLSRFLTHDIILRDIPRSGVSTNLWICHTCLLLSMSIFLGC